MSNSLVSVIIPTYGGAEYIQRCIDSVLSQTYNNIEIIVVDDNGVGTECQVCLEKIMATYQQNKKVHYICHEVNKNGSAARNTGVKHSHGKYIALLDDDDEFLPMKIERQVTLLETLSDEYAFVYCSQEVYKDSNLVRIIRAEKSGNLFYEKISHQFTVQTSGVLLRRTVYEEFAGFDESFQRHQDWEFLERIMSKYKIQADDFIGCIRHLYFRNTSVNPDKRNEWMEHYLMKMKPYIDRLHPKMAETIYNRNRTDVALVYLKAKKYNGFLCYCIQHRLPLRYIFQMMKRIVQSSISGGPLYS